MTDINIVLAGVGGQGSVLATEILGRAAVLAELPVVTSEVHGMSQRGGTVVTAVRLGRMDAAPVVPPGEADYLVAFEQLEAARQVDALRSGAVAIVADRSIPPVIEALRSVRYPAHPEELLSARGIDCVSVPADAIASDLGNPRLASTVMLGVLSVYLDIPEDAWHAAITQTVPPKTVADNKRAFQSGAAWRVAREKAVTAF